MARKVLKDTYYTFDPVNRKITVAKIIQRERLMLITNVVTGKVIYNFSDPSLGASDYELTKDTQFPKTIITLEYNTANMSATDELQIMMDEWEETFKPTDNLLDAVGKLRVAMPQSLIDTDFEYGAQPSKWETLVLQNNYPTFFARATGGNSLDVVSIVGNGVSPRSTVTVTCAQDHFLSDGDVVSVNEALENNAEGTFLVNQISSTVFEYVAKGVVSGNVLEGTLTSVYGGGIFDNAHVPGGAAGALNTWRAESDQLTPSTITVTTTQPHGLYPGTPILISTTSGSPLNGSWLITKVATTRTFEFTVFDRVTNPINTNQVGLYTKPEGYVDHRPFDGGVVMSTGNNVCGTQTIRQTRRYFRYQSGKSIQFSTGTKFTPAFDISYIGSSSTSSGANTITIETLQPNNLQPGAIVKIEGIETVGAYNPFNGEYEVNSILTAERFTVVKNFTSSINPIDQLPGGINAFVTAYQWKGSATRAGLFDDQNGFFIEYDGDKLYACLRSSIKELFGKISVTKYSSLVTGTGTRFRKQLVVGDMIVIRGQSYRVLNIQDDSTMNISPAYRGESTASARYLLTQTTRVPQTEWNIDRVDSTGPSGYTLDVSKMQMTFIDYSWYGAGTIRYGFRGINGEIIWCHSLPNNNVNTAAYMRSGNLPARYESINEPNHSARLISGGTAVKGSVLTPNESLIYVDDVSRWPNNGYLRIADNTNFEICRYTNVGAYNPTVGGYPVTVIRRSSMPLYYSGQPYALYGTSSAVNFAPDASIPGGGGTSQVSVQTISQNCAPVLSHWGSSVIMDGKYDQDQSFIFTAGMQRYLQVGGSGTVTANIAAYQVASGVVTLTTVGNHTLQNGQPVNISGIGAEAFLTAYQRFNNTATVYITGNNPFQVGDVITVTGLNPAYNGTYSVTARTATNLSYSNPGGNQGFTSQNPVGKAVGTLNLNGTYTITSVSGTTFTYNKVNVQDIAFTAVTSGVGSATQSFGATPTPRPLVSIRIAPSADNGLGRNFGVREIANRMQLKLDSIGVLSQGQFLIEGILNPATLNGAAIPSAWENVRVGSGSLAQVLYHDNTGTRGDGTPVTSPTNTINGGDRVFAFYTENSGGNNYSVSTQDLTKVRDLGNSILNGNGSNTNPGFPNGPDILTIQATNIGSTAANVLCRISWTEAQA
jgi:hypothetical protein